MLLKVSKTALLACLLTGALSGIARGDEPEWTTYHRDAARSGDDPEAVEPIAPVLAWQSENLGAPIWGQPLVLGGHVYVATVGNEIYELNSSTGAVEWESSAGAPVPSSELPCGDITPTVGIVGTPVIDTATGVIYAVADTWNAGAHQAEHVLKGYELSDGKQVLSTKVDPPGADPEALLQRTALNLDRGNVVFGLGGNDGDCSEYRGTAVAVPESGSAPRFWQVPIAPPSRSGGAVWAPSGPAVDGAGHIYATTGNPNPPPGDEATGYDYSDSVVMLDLSANFTSDPLSEPTTPLGWFEPPTWMADSNSDADLGSAGPELLPGGLLFQAGKNGTGYLVKAGTRGATTAAYEGRVCNGAGSFGGDAYANGRIYIPCTNGVQALSYEASACTFTPLWQGPSDAFGPPIIAGGSVWVLATGGFSGGGETLYGLDPATGTTRYTEHLPSPVIDHFASPSAAGGKLFVSTGESVTTYQIAQLQVDGAGPPPEGGAITGCTARGTTSDTPSGTPTSSPASTPAAVTSTDVSQARPSAGTKATASVPTLVHAHLQVGQKGWVRMTLHCPARRSGKCRGTVRLVAEITVTARGGRHRVRRVVAITLARARFGPRGKGDFVVVLRLGRSAEAHLRRHRDRLAVEVVISSAGSRHRRYRGVLR